MDERNDLHGDQIGAQQRIAGLDDCDNSVAIVANRSVEVEFCKIIDGPKPHTIT